ncbi:MAG: MATE family efflux transporter [Candidatus Cloacimonetes bacterium]|nr:MATE family efflux transporter [Candidatus Cloacimonadota bacterium]
MKNTRAKLIDGPIGKLLIKLTAPMIVGMLGMVAFNLVDTFFVGKLGATQLAALSFTFPIVLVVNSIALGVGMGASAIISRAIGEGDTYKVRRITTDGLLLAIVLVFIFVIIGLSTISPLFKLLGATTQVLPYIKQYMGIWYYGMFFVLIPMVGNNAIRATGDTKTPSAIMIVAVIMNFIMDPMLIFGLGPFPALGIRGAAISTVIARFSASVAATWVLVHRDRMVTFEKTPFREIFASWKSILFIGIPIAGARMILPVSVGVMTRIISVYGPKAVAGFGVASRIEFFALAVIRALSSVFGPFIGQNLGAKLFDRVKRGLRLAELFSLVWGFGIFIILFIFARPVAGIFNKDPLVVETIIKYLSIVPLGYGLQGVLLLCNVSLNVLQKPFHAAGLVTVQMFVLYIPLAYLGAQILQIQGAFIGITAAYCISGIIAHFFTENHIKKAEEKIIADSALN